MAARAAKLIDKYVRIVILGWLKAFLVSLRAARPSIVSRAQIIAKNSSDYVHEVDIDHKRVADYSELGHAKAIIAWNFDCLTSPINLHSG